MTAAPMPPDEAARLMALARYEILDTPGEVAFDRITRLAAHLLRAPVAAINFVDQFRQWGKSTVGLGSSTAPRHDSFCAWTILQSGPMVIENAHTDPRFAHNPMVTGDPHVHMYAGAPLRTPSGHHVGTLCVTDSGPHILTAADLQALQDLADLVVSELELRVSTLHLQRELGAQEQINQELRRTLAHAQVLDGITSLFDLDLSPEDVTLASASLLGEAMATDYTGLITFQGETLSIQAGYSHPRAPVLDLDASSQTPLWPGGVTHSLRTSTAPSYLDDYLAHPSALPWAVAAGVRQLAWLPLGVRGDTTFLLMAVRLQDHPVPRWRSSDRALLEAAGRSVRSALDRRALMEVAMDQARQDALTSVLNRRAFDEDLAAWDAEGRAYTLAVLDLDGMKAVNDQEGHAQGDKILRVFASVLRSGELDQGRIYRVGGDEFTLLLPGPWSEDEVLEVVETAVLAAQQVSVLRVGVSVGVAKAEGQPAAALLALADARMYQAKRRRKAAREQALEATM
ncbi:sensor domain-containing diguanylate cyclase [Deinococcus sonorensis]|uniref:Sensor domain-containing diguanylate cyclase n=2 Tax=Deinococcus sonorensis TaxID=309891 RepID=A0AAU7UBB0_9DEIO